MDTRSFRINIFSVITVYVAVIAVGIYTYLWSGASKESMTAVAFENLTGLFIAVPAAWLAYCFQIRQYYLTTTRSLWSTMVDAFEECVQYTFLENPSQSDYGLAQKKMSTAIEEVRIIFANIGETEIRRGLFPFESLKNIQTIHSRLGYAGSATLENRTEARRMMTTEWKVLRQHYLSEFTRGRPASPDTPFLQ